MTLFEEEINALRDIPTVFIPTVWVGVATLDIFDWFRVLRY